MLKSICLQGGFLAASAVLIVGCSSLTPKRAEPGLLLTPVPLPRRSLPEFQVPSPLELRISPDGSLKTIKPKPTPSPTAGSK
jgi:hypothetical protein